MRRTGFLARKTPLLNRSSSLRRSPIEHRAELTGLPRVVDSARQYKALPKNPPRVRKPRLADPITPETRAEVKDRAWLCCEACGGFIGETDGHMHHRQSRRFGDHTASNVVYLDAACHQRAHRNRDGEAWGRGWIVKSWEDPSLIPFVRWDETRFTEKLR